MPNPPLHRFPAILEAFDAIRKQLEISVATLNWNAEDIHRCTLILEELFTNSVKYGTSDAADRNVYLGIVPSADRSIVLTYEDRTPRHDPFANVSIEHTNPSLDMRRVGGLGVPLIVELTEQARHTALPVGNRITLVFHPRCPPPAATQQLPPKPATTIRPEE